MAIQLLYFLVGLLLTCQGKFIQNFDKHGLQSKNYHTIVVKEIVSGDTIMTEKFDNTELEVKIHLDGIKSPNIKTYEGKVAREHFRSLLYKYVNETLVVFIKQRKGKSSKIRANLYAGTHHINMEMIADGFARCSSNTVCSLLYQSLMERAHTNKLGIWNKLNLTKEGNKVKNSRKNSETFDVNRQYAINLVKVVDGDTIHVTLKDSTDNRVIKVRMSIIDAPEMKQSFGIEARDHLRDLLNNVDKDTLIMTVNGSDMYGRSLGIVKSGSIDINSKMLEDGFAWCYRYRCSGKNAYATETAQSERKGLFIDEHAITPWVWRKLNKKTRK